ncbi:hypothetical protein NDU88_004783 [Pleurodeles waltl]|uniref:Uncharacterized protein n=1 Tax=Pleurodeles waltl TaxID=8319 RepID=A0AAV7PE37_PLEWA|nr:hypothetical protein NDU88_004783 [Pleurodeles waltl]
MQRWSRWCRAETLNHSEKDLPPPASASNTAIKLDEILKAIADTKQDPSAGADAVAIELGSLRADEHKLADCVTRTEHDIKEIHQCKS